MEAGSKPALTALWGACVVLLLTAAGVFYVQGRPAAALHAEAVDRLRLAQSADSPDPVVPEPSRSGVRTDRAPATGPGIDAPGVSISARAAGPDTLDVSESVRLSEPTTSITIAPPDVSRAAADLADIAVVISGVQVTAGGQVVPVLESRITGRQRIDLPTATDTIEVRYLLEGGIVRTVPSKAGRALAGLAPVLAEPVGSPVAYVFGGEAIIGASCPELGPTAFACAGGQPGRLSITSPLARSQSLVLLQLNLPRP